MQIGQLEAFVEVARFASVSRAAEALVLTQPSVSARLQALEAELGDKLFVRTKRGVRLTDAGRTLLPYAERALAAVREGRAALQGLRTAQGGKLVLGASPAVSTYVLPGVLKRFRLAHPQVEVAVRTGHSEEILQLVLSDDVQVGLVRRLRHPEVETTVLFQDELVLVVPAGHRFARQGVVTIEEMGQEGLVLFDRSSSYYELTQSLFLEAGVVPRLSMELDNIEAAKKMVEEGLGIALLPRIAVEREIALHTLAEVTLVDAPPVRREILAIRRRGAGPSAVIQALLALMRQRTPPRGDPFA